MSKLPKPMIKKKRQIYVRILSNISNLNTFYNKFNENHYLPSKTEVKYCATLRKINYVDGHHINTMLKTNKPY